MEEGTQNLSVESIPIDAPEPEVCLPKTEFPAKRKGIIQRGSRRFEITDTKDPVTGQWIYLHVELV